MHQKQTHFWHDCVKNVFVLDEVKNYPLPHLKIGIFLFLEGVSRNIRSRIIGGNILVHQIGLHHPLDGITNPEYKLLHFIQLTIFRKKEALAFNRDRWCHLVSDRALLLLAGNLEEKLWFFNEKLGKSENQPFNSTFF